MGVFDKFMNAIRVENEEYDDEEFYDEEDDIEEEAEEPKKSFFSKLKGRRSEEDTDDFYEEEDSEEEAPKRFFFGKKKDREEEETVSSTKVMPMRRHAGRNMEVHVIKPLNMEDTRQIADTLLSGCTVVLNLEGLDVEVAQRVIDFSSGSCYAIAGSLQKVSSYIFILTPNSVEITGDITDMLNGTLSTMRNNL